MNGRLLIVGDSPTFQTGFARVVQNLARRWRYDFDEIHFWGIGYSGYPGVPGQPKPWFFKEPFTIYPASAVGPWYSADNLASLLRHIHQGGYTHVWCMQDSFALRLHSFAQALRELCAHTGARTFLYLPVDATLDPDWAAVATCFDCAVAYTEYGRNEILRHVQVPQKRMLVLPHGVDTSVYRVNSEQRRSAARAALKWVKPDDVLLLNVNAHQRRKDVVRSLEILAALYARSCANWKFKLLMHMSRCGPASEQSDLEVSARQLGLERGVHWDHDDGMFLRHLAAAPESALVDLYNAADGYLTTSLGEGWGLGITEALACGMPVFVPDHTACREIAGRVREFRELGMASRAHVLPTEPWHVCLPGDNCRLRKRVDVERAVDMISSASLPAPRMGLNKELAEWLSWDRIAREWLRLFQEIDKCALPPKAVAPPSVQTSEPAPEEAVPAASAP